MELRSGTITDATAREFNRAFKVEQDRRKLAEEMRRKDLRESAIYSARDRIDSHRSGAFSNALIAATWFVAATLNAGSTSAAIASSIAGCMWIVFAFERYRKATIARRTLEALQADTSTR